MNFSAVNDFCNVFRFIKTVCTLGKTSNTTLRILSVNGGAGVPPKSVTYFLDQNQVFFEQKTPFLALFEENFSGKNPLRGGNP